MKNSPKPSESLRPLAPLAGNWRGGAESESEKGDLIESDGRYEIQFILNGSFLAIDYTQAREEKADADYAMHGLVGWNEAKQCYFFHWYDSLAGSATEIFGAVHGDILTVEGPDPVRGGHTRFIWDFSKDVLVVTFEVSEDGKQWNPAYQSTYSPDSGGLL